MACKNIIQPNLHDDVHTQGQSEETTSNNQSDMLKNTTPVQKLKNK
jgi:hypothetical protein